MSTSPITLPRPAIAPASPDARADARESHAQPLGRIGARNSGDTTFGAVLARYRNRRGFSQSELARRSELDNSYVSRLEAGQRTPTRAVVSRLTAELGLLPTDALALRSAAGFLAAGDGVVARSVLAEIDQALSDPFLPDAVATSVRAQLDGIKCVLVAVIEGRVA